MENQQNKVHLSKYITILCTLILCEGIILAPVYLLTDLSISSTIFWAQILVAVTTTLTLFIFVFHKMKVNKKLRSEYEAVLDKTPDNEDTSISTQSLTRTKLEKEAQRMLLLEGEEAIYKENSLSSPIIGSINPGEYFTMYPKSNQENIIPIKSDTEGIDGFIKGDKNKAFLLGDSPQFASKASFPLGIADIYKVTPLKKFLSWCYTLCFFGFFLSWHLMGESVPEFFIDIFKNGLIPILFFIIALMLLLNSVFMLFQKTGTRINGIFITDDSVTSFENIFPHSIYNSFINGGNLSFQESSFKKENLHGYSITEIGIVITKTEGGFYESAKIQLIVDDDESNCIEIPLNRECIFWKDNNATLQHTKTNIIHAIESIYETFKHEKWFNEANKRIIFSKENNAVKNVMTVVGFGLIGGLVRSSFEKRKQTSLIKEISNLSFQDELLKKYFSNIVVERGWNIEVAQ